MKFGVEEYSLAPIGEEGEYRYPKVVFDQKLWCCGVFVYVAGLTVYNNKGKLCKGPIYCLYVRK